MGVSFQCGHCGKSFDVGYEVAGKTGRCKRCGSIFTIPLASTTVPVPPRVPAPAEGLDSPATLSRPRSRPVKSAPAARSRAFDSAILPPPRPVAPAPTGGTPDPDVLLPPRALPTAAPARGKAPRKKGKPFAWMNLKRSPGFGWGAKLFCAVWVLGIILRLLGLANVHQPPGDARIATPAELIVKVQQVSARYDAAPIALPPFPDIGPGRPIEPGVMFHEIVLGPSNQPLWSPPGQGGKLWLYLPSASAGADHSLPCVLISGAGSRLVHGMALAEGDRAEHLPYVRAGFAVLAFELDGPVADNPSDEAMGQAMIRFLLARAGLVNAHIALEYALAKVPAVDPARISIAGHSSAGVVAVLFAETDPRLRSAVAYAPAVDLEKRFGPTGVSTLQQGGFGDLATRYSPRNKVGTLGCPLFLFQARDDTNTPAAEAEEFARQASAAGKSVTLDMVETGGHFQAMVRQGIPHAIAWLKGESIPPEGAIARRPNAKPGPAARPGNVPERTRERIEALQKRRDERRQRLGPGPR